MEAVLGLLLVHWIYVHIPRLFPTRANQPSRSHDLAQGTSLVPSSLLAHVGALTFTRTAGPVFTRKLRREDGLNHRSTFPHSGHRTWQHPATQRIGLVSSVKEADPMFLARSRQGGTFASREKTLGKRAIKAA